MIGVPVMRPILMIAAAWRFCFGLSLAMAAFGAGAVATAAPAGTFGTGYAPGGQYLRSSEPRYGVRVEGLFPRSSKNRNPVTIPFNSRRTFANNCRLDMNCGPGNRCLINAGLYGVCVKR